MNLERLDINSQEYKDLLIQHDKEIAVAQMQDKMFINLINGGFTAPVAPVDTNSSTVIIESLERLKSSLKPVEKFFEKIQKTDKVPVEKVVPAREKTEDEIIAEIIAKKELRIKESAIARLAKKKKGS